MIIHSKNTLIQRCFIISIFLCVFFTVTSFRTRGYADSSIDLQIIVKLIVWFWALAISLITYKKWKNLLLKQDNFLLICFLILLIISTVYAPNPMYSLGCVFSLLSITLLMLSSSYFLDNKVVADSVFSALSVTAILSLLVYIFIPSFGRVPEWQDGILVQGSRIGGIIGSANGVGFLSAFGLIIAYYYREYFVRKSLSLYVLFTLANMITLLLSYNRMSIAALFVSIYLVYLIKFSYLKSALFLLGLSLIAFIFVLIDIDSLLRLVSRSGDLSEITSGTGRSFIWGVTLDIINQKPFFGWGYGSAIYVLPELSEAVGFVASSTHNLILQALLSVGYIGLLLFVALFVVKYLYIKHNHDNFKKLLMLFIFIIGLTEAMFLNGVAGGATIAFALLFIKNERC